MREREQLPTVCVGVGGARELELASNHCEGFDVRGVREQIERFDVFEAVAGL